MEREGSPDGEIGSEDMTKNAKWLEFASLVDAFDDVKPNDQKSILALVREARPLIPHWDMLNQEPPWMHDMTMQWEGHMTHEDTEMLRKVENVMKWVKAWSAVTRVFIYKKIGKQVPIEDAIADVMERGIVAQETDEYYQQTPYAFHVFKDSNKMSHGGGVWLEIVARVRNADLLLPDVRWWAPVAAQLAEESIPPLRIVSAKRM